LPLVFGEKGHVRLVPARYGETDGIQVFKS
jgi:hypothetical protein